MKICLFLFTEDGVAAAARRAELEAQGVVAPVRLTYETPAPTPWEGPAPAAPMDYLDAADIDDIYADLEGRQRRMPAIRLADGAPLGDWTGGADTAPAMWTWLTALTPYWHVTSRLARTLERMIAREAPDAYAVARGDGEATWAILVLDRLMAARWPQVRALDPRPDEPEPAAAVAPPQAPPDFSALRALPAVARAREALDALCRRMDAQIARPVGRHVVLLTRGAVGARWMRSATTGAGHLLDEYSERMPDALIEECRRAGDRLTIIYEGAPPVASAATPLYASRHPNFVCEIEAAAIARVSSQMRKPVLDFYAAAVAGVCADPAFQACFTFLGVNLFQQFRDYVTRSIANLVTLQVTQYEAWRALAQALRPDVIVAGRLEAKPWICRAFHDVGARAASIKLGIGEEMMPSMIAVKADGAYDHYSYPDAFLVWGEEQARYLAGRLPEYRGAIVPVGRARSDTFVIEAPLQRSDDTRRRLGLPVEAQIILYGANYRSRYGRWPEQKWGSVCFSRESWVACFDHLVDAAGRVENGHVLVKPHPADDMEFIAALVAERGLGRATLFPAGADLHNVEIIGASDIFVSTVTSMFAEAASLGRVSVNIWRPDVNLLYERGRWEKYNAIAHGVETFEAMTEAILRFLGDDDAYRAEATRTLAAMERYFGGLSGDNARLAARSALGLSATGEAARNVAPTNIDATAILETT